jgi:hypothetical protein
VIGKISQALVPAAINLYKVRKATDGARELFLSVQRQKDQYQGIWIVCPEGKVLASHHNINDPKTWTDEVLETIDAGLKAFGEVAPREAKPTNPLPFRGLGVQPDGGVQIAVYTRCMHRGKADGPSVIDTLALSAEEWAALAPPAVEAGAEWSVPEAVARKFVRALSPSSDQSTMPLPREAKKAELKGRVESVENRRAKITLTGAWESEHAKEGNKEKIVHANATAEGIAWLEGHAFESLLMVFQGVHHDAPPWDGPRETGAVVEWRRAAR